MSGKMWGDSKPGKGSAFHFITTFSTQSGPAVQPGPVDVDNLRDLPVLIVDDNATNRCILEENEPSIIIRHTIREDRQRLNILLVEDNKVNQMVAEHVIEKMGHSVVPVEHGGKALEALDNEHFDLVFMDIQMPVMDGYKATAAIRKKESEGSTYGNNKW